MTYICIPDGRVKATDRKSVPGTVCISFWLSMVTVPALVRLPRENRVCPAALRRPGWYRGGVG
eukprot:3514351-Rhodomonas_salina.1